MKQRILEIKLGALGDFVLTTGAMKTLRQHHKNDHITLLTTKPFVKIAQQSGYFDEILVDKRSRNPFDWWQVCKKIIADGQFDIIYDFQNNKRTKKRYFTLARLFSKKKLLWASWSDFGWKCRDIQKKNRFDWGKLTSYDVRMSFETPNLNFMKGEQKYFHELPEKYILMIPGCSKAHPYKRWPAENYADLADKLNSIGIKSVLLGTDEEKDVIETIKNKCPSALSFLNKSTLMDIPALAKRALATIGNDTGPTHMAALSGNPCVYLFSERTRKSANHFDNIVNLFGREISDITPSQAFNALIDKAHLNQGEDA